MVTTATIISMFSTFVLFVGGVIAITEMVNKLFKVENKITKLIISWVLSIGLSVLGFVFELGFFADIVDEVIKEYEKYGAYSELISLFESNLVGE